MEVKLIRISDNEIIIKKDVKEVKKNIFGNIVLIFNNDKRLTLQERFFKLG